MLTSFQPKDKIELMPYRSTPLAQDQIYHVFNRGVARLPIFSTPRDFQRFIELIDYYRFQNTPVSFSHFKKIPREDREKIFAGLQKEGDIHIKILAFCLMNNHFHFLLKQISEKGIAKFISNLQNGYAKYFNIKSERSGPLFQPMFKGVRIVTDEQLLHVSRYIHLNPSTDYLVKIDSLEDYIWSSYKNYIKKSSGVYQFINSDLILGLIGNEDKYKEFVFDQAEYQRTLAQIRHLI